MIKDDVICFFFYSLFFKYALNMLLFTFSSHDIEEMGKHASKQK